MEKLKFELGEWVGTDHGYGQIMYVRPFFAEDYENQLHIYKKGTFKRYVYICKILCGFDGKIRKTKRINIYTVVDSIDKNGKAFVKEIKQNQNEEYLKYIFYDDKKDLTSQKFVYYKLDHFDFKNKEIEEKLYLMYQNLEGAFTYKEFMKEFKKHDMPFKLENIIEYGGAIGSESSVCLRFDSRMYKVKNNEAVFYWVQFFRSFKFDNEE
jgi:hypothetical protein